ncbi:MAG: hypothetical protein Kow00108_13720 [Calditrichia bacterium]
MVFKFPIIEDRKAKDFKEEAIKRIKRLYPEWHIEDPSDIGNMLTEIFSWYAEMIAYQMNTVPEKLFLEFINLLAVEPRPAIPARSLVQFKFNKDKLDGFSSLTFGELYGPEYLTYTIEEKNNVKPIYLENVYYIKSENENLIWNENKLESQHLEFSQQKQILNRLSISFEDPRLANLFLPIDFTITISFQCGNLQSVEILEEWFKQGKFFLETNDAVGYVELNPVEVIISDNAIHLNIAGGKEEYQKGNGKIFCIKDMELEKLYNMDFELDYPILSWQNHYKPFKVESFIHYNSKGEAVESFPGERDHFFQGNSAIEIEIPYITQLSADVIQIHFGIENINKARGDKDLRWILRDHKGNQINLRKGKKTSDLERNGVFKEGTNNLQTSGTVEIAITEQIKKAFPTGENSLVLRIDNSESEPYYIKDFALSDISIQFSGKEEKIEKLEYFNGKNYRINGKQKKTSIKFNGSTYRPFKKGYLLELCLPSKEQATWKMPLFVKLNNPNKSVDENSFELTAYIFDNGKWCRCEVENIKYFPGYGFLMDIKTGSMSKMEIYDQEGYFLLLDLNNYNGKVEAIYENVVECTQTEIKKEYFCGVIEPLIFQQIKIEDGFILDVGEIRIKQGGKVLKSIKKQDFKIRYDLNMIEFYGDDLIYLKGSDIYLVDLLLTQGDKGNILQDTLSYKNEDRSFFRNVTNIIPAMGGKEAENTEDLKQRIPELLNQTDRAITLGDYERLIRSFSSEIIRHKVVYNYELKRIEVFLLLKGADKNISDNYWQAISSGLEKYLLERSPVNTALRIKKAIVPEVCAEIHMVTGISMGTNGKQLWELEEQLKRHFSPWPSEGYGGWPFGKTIHSNNIIAFLYQLPEVKYVEKVSLREKQDTGWSSPTSAIHAKASEILYLSEIAFYDIQNRGVNDDEIGF